MVTKIVVILNNIEISGPKLVHRWVHEWQTTG